MDHMQITVEANDQDWKRRCNRRIEKLNQFPGQDASLQPELVHESKIMNSKLYEAVDNGDVDRFVDVLEKLSADKGLPLSVIFDQVTHAGDSLLHVAADLGREHIAELICHNFPRLLTSRNICGDIALHVAARSKNSNIIKIILSQYTIERSKCEIEMKDEEEITRIKNEYGDTALHEAVNSRHIGVITELLLADKLVVHYLNKSGKSPLYSSVLTRDVEIFGLLLPIPFPASLPRCIGNSPLHAAILCRKPVVLKEILARRSDLIYFRDEDGGTPLHYAACIGYVEGVRILLETPTQTVQEKNNKGNLPIHQACKMGHIEVVKVLLQQEGPNPKGLLNQKGQNILHVAAKAGKNNVVKCLLRNKKIDEATINGKDVNGNTPLHLAARNVFIENLYSLSRDKRINLKLINNEGLTARDIVMLITGAKRLTYQEYLSIWILHSVGVPVSEKVLSMARCPKQDELKTEWAKDRFNTYMVVSILMITVTFAAGFTLPGSVNSSDDPDPQKRGMAVLVHKPMFQVFTICNTIAMYSSTAVCIVLMFVRSDDYRSASSGTLFVVRMLAVALVTMGVAFLAAVRLVVSELSWLANVITIIAAIFLFIILFCYGLFTLNIYLHQPILRDLSELRLRILIWYARTSTLKVIRDKHVDKRM